jgi:hypothetical protein
MGRFLSDSDVSGAHCNHHIAPELGRGVLLLFPQYDENEDSEEESESLEDLHDPKVLKRCVQNLSFYFHSDKTQSLGIPVLALRTRNRFRALPFDLLGHADTFQGHPMIK